MKFISFLLTLALLAGFLFGCAPAEAPDIVATTLPVYQFTSRLCEGTGLTVTQLVTESVSCLHDYSLSVSQVRAVEAARTVVLSGAGLEAFMEDLLTDRSTIDSSHGIDLLTCEDSHGHEDHHHSHEADSHIWLSPTNAMMMASNICDGLILEYPQFEEVFKTNLSTLSAELCALEAYGQAQLAQLSSRDLITFHDGFSYFADAFGLTILEAVEEESGSEASARELIHLIELVQEHRVPAIFTEINGSVSAAAIISAEAGIPSFPLDMAMSGKSYFDAMYHNIDTIREALK